MSLINRFLKFNNEPVLKQTPEPKSNGFLRSAAKGARIFVQGLLIGGSVITGANIGREVYQENFTEYNEKVEFNYGLGTFILDNRDPRTPSEVFNDIDSAILSMENFEDIFDKNLDIEEKKVLVDDIIQILNKEANLNIYGVLYVNIPFINESATYFGFYNKGVSYGNNFITVLPEFLEENSAKDITELLYHEIAGHAFDYQYYASSDHCSSLDKKIYEAGKDDKSRYFTKSSEIISFIRTQYFMNLANKQAHSYRAVDNYDQTEEIINEMIIKLQGLDYTPQSYSGNFNANLIDGNVNYEIDLSEYGKLTVSEIFELGFEDMLKDMGIELEEGEKMEDSLAYQVFMNYGISEELEDVRYVDIINKNHYVRIDSMEENLGEHRQIINSIIAGEEYDHYETYDVAEHLAYYVNALRYGDVTTDQANLFKDFIDDYYLLLSEEDIQKYLTDDYVEVYENIIEQENNVEQEEGMEP